MEVQVLEPDPDFRDLLAFLLRYDGHQVRAAQTLHAAEAVEAVPLLILRDTLPGTTAHELRQLIQRRAPRATLVLTARSDRARVAAMLGVPSELCLGLPLHPVTLRERLATLAAASEHGAD